VQSESFQLQSTLRILLAHLSLLLRTFLRAASSLPQASSAQTLLLALHNGSGSRSGLAGQVLGSSQPATNTDEFFLAVS
jgi:hypothetical protein